MDDPHLEEWHTKSMRLNRWLHNMEWREKEKNKDPDLHEGRNNKALWRAMESIAVNISIREGLAGRSFPEPERRLLKNIHVHELRRYLPRSKRRELRERLKPMEREGNITLHFRDIWRKDEGEFWQMEISIGGWMGGGYTSPEFPSRAECVEFVFGKGRAANVIKGALVQDDLQTEEYWGDR